MNPAAIPVECYFIFQLNSATYVDRSHRPGLRRFLLHRLSTDPWGRRRRHCCIRRLRGYSANDRVLAMTLGAALGKPEMGGFQEYVIADAGLTCHIPGFIPFAEASVFPLCVATSAHALFSIDFLAVPKPKVEPVSIGKSILVWGGSSAVGSNAIPLAKAAGLEIFSTSSRRKF